MSGSAAEPWKSLKLPEYEICDRILIGRFRGFLRAHDRTRGRAVWLQLVDAEAVARGGGLSAIRHRWQSLSRIAPRGFVRPQAFRRHGDAAVLVWRPASGQTLDRLLGDKGLPPQQLACRWVCEVARLLEGWHRADQVHGDVRSGNVLVDEPGEVRLFLDPTWPEIVPPLLPDTTDAENGWERAVDYWAPELSRGQRRFTTATDIYALGTLLYRLLSGKFPFPTPRTAEQLVLRDRQAFAPLELLGIPHDLSRCVAKMVARLPEDRYPRLGPLVVDLEQNLGRSGADPPPAPPWHDRPAPTPPRPEEIPLARPVPAQAVAPLLQPTAPVPTPTLIAIGDRSTARRTETPSQQRMRPLAWAGVLFTLAAAGAVFLYARRSPSDPQVERTAPTTQATGDGSTAPLPPAAASHPITVAASAGSSDAGSAAAATLWPQQVVPDDGRLLWAAPTQGPPLDLQYLIPGSPLVIAARVSELAVLDEGRRTLEALGPEFSAALDQWQTAAGIRLEEIEQLLISWPQDGQGPARPCFLIRLHQATPSASLVAKWPAAHDASRGGQACWQSDQWCYLLPQGQTEAVTLFVMGSPPAIQQVIEAIGQPVLWRREIEQLWQASDRQRSLTILFEANYLLSGLATQSRPELDPLPRQLAWLLPDSVPAGMASLHLGTNCYLEWRLIGNTDHDPYELASALQTALDTLPDRAETLISTLHPHPYWRLIALRYPAMIRFLVQQTRVGVERGQTMLNTVAPLEAVHNLVFAHRMLLLGPQAETGQPAQMPSGPRDLDALLATPTTVAFDQASLESAIAAIVAEVRTNHPRLPFTFDIRILGEDLELGGITRNQQIVGFREQDKALGEVLTALLMRANPITTVKSPQELEQKLVWTVGPDPARVDTRIVLVTTRDGAEKRGLPLPGVFRSPDAEP